MPRQGEPLGCRISRSAHRNHRNTSRAGLRTLAMRLTARDPTFMTPLGRACLSPFTVAGAVPDSHRLPDYPRSSIPGHHERLTEILCCHSRLWPRAGIIDVYMDKCLILKITDRYNFYPEKQKGSLSSLSIILAVNPALWGYCQSGCHPLRCPGSRKPAARSNL